MDNGIHAEIKLAGFNSKHPVIVESTLRVETGRTVMVAGPSGTGKTLLLLAVTGVLKHFLNGVVEGSISLNGLNPLDYSEYTRIPSEVGFIMQDPERQIIYPTPLDEATVVLEARGYSYEEARRKAFQILGTLGLAGKAEEHVENLSGGEKKRLAIALSIIHDPRVLLLDEPSSSLDPNGVGLVKKIIAEGKKKGCSILLTEHKVEFFTDVVDEVYVLAERKIQALRKGFPVNYEKAVECREASNSSGEVVIEARGLSVGYNTPLVRDVNMHVRRGEVVVLAGPNGSGKTTILRTLAGFIRPLEGEVKGGGRGVFYALQNPDIAFIHVSVEKELLDVSRRTGVGFEELVSMYPWFSEVRRLHPLRLSHGQRRWLTLLISYAYGSRLMILDEPTSGIDYALYNRLIELLRELKLKKRGILIATHDPRLIADVADRVYVVGDGGVREADKCSVVEAMYKSISRGYT